MVEVALAERGRAVLSVSCRGMRSADELGSSILAAVRASRFGDKPPDTATVRTSAGVSDLVETIEILRVAGIQMPAPVLLLDGLDEADYPARMASAVEQLVPGLDKWTIVVASGRVRPPSSLIPVVDAVHRLLHGHAPLNDRFVQNAVDMALAGIQPAPTTRN